MSETISDRAAPVTAPVTAFTDNALAAVLAARELDYDHIRQTHPHLFADSSLSLFLSAATQQHILQLIGAIEQVVALDAYQNAALADAPEIARKNPGYPAVFTGYDFHLDNDGRPWLIEINTNAGGAFLNSCLVEASAFGSTSGSTSGSAPEKASSLWAEWVAMFRAVWQTRRGDRVMRRIALVDENPEQQYLAPEFTLFRRCLADTGIDVRIAAPDELVWDGNALLHRGDPVDLVYNRLTDFTLSAPANAALKAALLADSAVITPHPYAHALYANKQNLVRLADPVWLANARIPDEIQAILRAGIPPAFTVLPDMSPTAMEALWQGRKTLFFKPVSGFGGRAVYRGDKLTRKIFAEICKGGYIAQRLIPPATRRLRDSHQSNAKNGDETNRDATNRNETGRELKFDLRCYTFQGQAQLYAARFYQGQTTNFRTPDGGFAPVFLA